jgi:hypothetical protein
MVIGAQKAGTSAFCAMLAQHPQIVAPSQKEPNFFDGIQIKYGDFLTYHSRFPLPYRLKPNKLTFEGTTNYLFHPDCPHRIYDYAPKMRLIAILREPVARAYSGWNYYHSFATSLDPAYKRLADRRSFEASIAEEIKRLELANTYYVKDNSPYHYVARGVYVEQLENYFRYFPREAILILNYNDFVQTPEVCFASVCRFLSIDDTFIFTLERRNVTTYEAEISKRTADMLRAYYAPYNQRLFTSLGREFAW